MFHICVYLIFSACLFSLTFWLLLFLSRRRHEEKKVAREKLSSDCQSPADGDVGLNRLSAHLSSLICTTLSLNPIHPGKNAHANTGIVKMGLESLSTQQSILTERSSKTPSHLVRHCGSVFSRDLHFSASERSRDIKPLL